MKHQTRQLAEKPSVGSIVTATDGVSVRITKLVPNPYNCRGQDDYKLEGIEVATGRRVRGELYDYVGAYWHARGERWIIAAFD